MDLVKILKVNEVYVKIVTDPSIKMELSEHFTFDVPGAKFMPSYKNKMWDGKIRLLNLMTGLLYAGLATEVIKFCERLGYEVEVDPNLIVNREFDYNDLVEEVNSKFTARDYQERAIVEAIKKDRGLFLSPTASGKSFIIYMIMRYHMAWDRRILIVVPTTSLVEQMASDFVEYNHNESLPIHKIRGGVSKVSTEPITISTWQSIYKMGKDYYEQFDVVIIDEAHLAKAKSLTNIMEKCVSVRYRYGFTGTLDGTSVNEMVLNGIFGPTYHVTKTKELINKNVLSPFKIKALVIKHAAKNRQVVSSKKLKYADEISWITTYEKRNKIIRNLVKNLEGNTLILFNFVEKHGKPLFEMLSEIETHNVYFIHGGVKTDEREEIRHTVRNSRGNIIVASLGTFSTGANLPELDHLVFAHPSKGRIRNLQSIGRVLRKAEGKTMATLYDIVDDLSWKKHQNFALLHFIERIKIYSSEGFDFKIYHMEIEDANSD